MQCLKLVWVLIFLHSAVAFAQNEALLSLGKSEEIVSCLLRKANQAPSNKEKLLYNDSVCCELKKVLITELSFDYPFDSLTKIGKIYSPDRSFRIVNWNMPLTDGTYQYKGLIQVVDTKTKKIKVFELNDQSDEVTKPENSVLSAGKWFGVLYYYILKNVVDNHTYYTMLGLRYHSLFLSRKVIEVLYFDEWGNPVFGAPIFQVNNKIKHRIVFDFSARVGMTLKYNNDLKMIVCDHLGPSEAKYKDQYEYYGPDFSFDGYEFVKGKWMLRTDLNLKNPNPSHTPNRQHPPDSNQTSAPVIR
jgi:hypothetical protein